MRSGLWRRRGRKDGSVAQIFHVKLPGLIIRSGFRFIALLQEFGSHLREQRVAEDILLAARQIARLFRAVETGAALDPWLDRDFKGLLPLEEPEGLPTSVPAC